MPYRKYTEKVTGRPAVCLPSTSPANASWTLEKLMNKHTSKPYNPNIAYVFYLAGFIESWGRGVEKICNALKAENLPRPEYSVNPEDIMIKFSGPEDRIVRVSGRLSEKLSDRLSDKLSDKISDKERRTFELLLEDLKQHPAVGL